MLAEQFHKLFAGLSRAYGRYVLREKQGEGKRQGTASTVHEPLTVALWEQHLEGKVGLGVVPIKDDATCSWGAIDIDKYPIDIPEIERSCKNLNLPLVPCKTKSGGCHLFLFLADGVPASLVRSRLIDFASRLGYNGVEIFPKQVKLANEKDIGNWLNMPYFGDDRYAIIGGKPATAEAFLKRAAKLQLTEEQLEAIELPESAFDDGPPCLQHLSMTGGVPDGSRNNGVFAMGVYARLKYPETWEHELNQLNVKHVQQPLPAREVITIVKSLNRKKYFYPCDKAPCVNNCDKTVCKTRQYGIGGGSDELNVSLGPLVKLNTQPPTWITDIDGVRFELTTEDLLSQEKFRKQCVERINKLPNRIKAVAWDKWLSSVLEKVEITEVPDDAGIEGQFMQAVEQFCTGLAQARVKDEVLLGKPYTEDGRTYFRGSDLLRYLKQQKVVDMPLRQAWVVLRRFGAQHNQFKLKGRCVRCWSVPEFEKQDEDFDDNL